MNTFEIGEINNNQLWYFSLSVNLLVCVDLVTGEQVFITSVPGEELYGYRLFGSIQIIGEKLILVPFSASSLVVFNIKFRRFEKMILIKDPGESQFNYRKSFKFQSSVKYNNKVYMFGLTYPEIVIYDCSAEEVFYSSNWFNIFCHKFGINICNIKDHFLFEKYNCKIGHIVYIPMGFTNKIMSMDLLSGDVDFIEIGRTGDIYYNIAYANNRFWLACKEGNTVFISYDLRDGKQQEYGYDLIDRRYSPCELIAYNDKIIVIPIRNLEPLIIDQFGSVRESNISKEKSYIHFYKIYHEKFVIYSSLDKKISIFNKNLSLYTEINNDEKLIGFKLKAFKLLQEEQKNIMENVNFSLNEFLKMISKDEDAFSLCGKQSEGKKIYTSLKISK